MAVTLSPSPDNPRPAPPSDVQWAHTHANVPPRLQTLRHNARVRLWVPRH